MKFRLIDLETFLAKKPDWTKIVDLLNKKSFESNLYKDYLEVDILPNRFSDSGNIFGLAREISIISNIPLKSEKFNYKTFSLDKNKKYPNIYIKTKNCLSYDGILITDIKVKSSPKWLKEFLEFYEFNSVNFLVDLANYSMIKYGAPLHLFDLEKINKNVYIRQAKENEKFLSLKNTEYILNFDDIVIADESKILALAGIQGSKLSEVDLNTKNILLESAIFNPINIYKTSRRLNLQTQASYRFERNISLYSKNFTLKCFLNLVEKNNLGKISKNIISYSQIKESKKIIKLNLDKLYNYFGKEIPKNLLLKTIKSIDCKLVKYQKNYIELVPPSYRIDLNLDVDIIEEIIRLIGYDSIEYKNPTFYHFPQENHKLKYSDEIKNILTKAGFTEIYTYSFISDKDYEIFDSFMKNNKIEPIKIINPVSNLFNFYRPFIFINLIKVIATNLNLFNWLRKKDFNFFEIGKIGYKKNNNFIEEENLSFITTDTELKKSYFKLKGALNYLFENLKLEKIKYQPFSEKIKHFDNLNMIEYKNETIGILFILSRDLANKYDIKQPIAGSEIFLDKIYKFIKKEETFKPPISHPAIFRDISMIVPIYTNIFEIENEIYKLGGNILEKIELFDVYSEDNLLKDEKSLSFHLIFRDKKRTLNDEEVNTLLDKIIENLKIKYKAKIR
jgi:phenylalanyl-tRNA synthetase beta chain